MKVAVFGAGAWGKNHIKTLNSLDALGAIVEVNPSARNDITKIYTDVPVFESVDEIIKSDIPAAVIATTATTHFDIAKKLLLAGKDVFVEKPMTLNVLDAEELVDLAETNGRILMVGHLLLHQPAIQWLRRALISDIIGKLHSIHQHRLGLGRARTAENVLWSLGVHDVAVVLYLIGRRPINLEVHGHRILQTNVEDDIYLHLIFPDGVYSHLHCSWLWPRKDRGMVIVGTTGMLEYNEVDQVVTLHKKRIDQELKNVDDGCEVVFEGSGEPLKLELQHFIECVEKRKAPISDGRSGLEVMQVMQQTVRRMTL